MNRNEEFYELKRSLDDSPLKLDYTLERARAKKAARAKSHKTRNAVFVPLGSLAAVFVLFVSLVNLSPAFAETLSEIPVLSRLAEAVSFNQSLQNAVNNNYMQEINQSQTKNGVTATIEYVIADEKQVNIFYSLKSDEYDQMDGRFDLDGKGMTVVSGYNDDIPDGELRRVVADYVDGKAPEKLGLTLSVIDMTGHPEFGAEQEIAEFGFEIDFDPTLVAESRVIKVGKTIEMDGQQVTIDTLEIYPTHMRMNISAAESNTMWLTALMFSFETSDGKTLEQSGITSYCEVGTPQIKTYLIDSPYFYGSESLTFKVTGAHWLKKGGETVHINLAEKTADNLPEGTELESCEKVDGDWVISLSGERVKEGNTTYQIFGSSYFDAAGTNHTVGGYGRGTKDGQYVYEYILEDYTGDEVWFELLYTEASADTETMEISLK